LIQEVWVIVYASNKLWLHEENYVTHDLELLAIVHSLKIWKHCLVGRKFELKSDHSGWQHIFTQGIWNAGQRRMY
jgi:hypothetical protein